MTDAAQHPCSPHRTWQQTLLCQGAAPTSGSALYASASAKARRMLSMAVCRCAALPHPMPGSPSSSSRLFSAISAAMPCVHSKLAHPCFQGLGNPKP